METKYNVCDKVSYFNDASQKVETSTVQGIKIIATKVHANQDGVDVEAQSRLGRLAVSYVAIGVRFLYREQVRSDAIIL